MSVGQTCSSNKDCTSATASLCLSGSCSPCIQKHGDCDHIHSNSWCFQNQCFWDEEEVSPTGKTIGTIFVLLVIVVVLTIGIQKVTGCNYLKNCWIYLKDMCNCKDNICNTKKPARQANRLPWHEVERRERERRIQEQADASESQQQDLQDIRIEEQATNKQNDFEKIANLQELTMSNLKKYQITNDKGNNKDLDEDMLCIVCFQNKKIAKFEPCNHCNCCSLCAVEIFKTNGYCPICREKITNVVSSVKELG